MIYRLFTLIFFILFNFTFGDVYIPKTPREKQEFAKLQKEKITIALIDNPFYNLSYPEIHSLNYIAKTFLKDYMQLDVNFKTISYKDLEKVVESNEVDGVALIPKSSIFDQYLDFSNSIFSEEIFVISQTIPLNL